MPGSPPWRSRPPAPQARATAPTPGHSLRPSRASTRRIPPTAPPPAGGHSHAGNIARGSAGLTEPSLSSRERASPKEALAPRAGPLARRTGDCCSTRDAPNVHEAPPTPRPPTHLGGRAGGRQSGEKGRRLGLHSFVRLLAPRTDDGGWARNAPNAHDPAPARRLGRAGGGGKAGRENGD